MAMLINVYYWVWWNTLVISALRKLRQEHEEANLGHKARPCLKI